MKRSDVLVVGGGPSGLRLAARLAESGIDVRVLEKKNGIGSNIVCAGIIGKEVFEEFELNRDSTLGELQTVRLVSPFGTSIVYRHPKAFAYVVDRGRFDRNLAKEALEKGAAIDLNTRVEDLRISEDGVNISTQTEEGKKNAYCARLAVIASGIDYSLHKKIGLGTPKEYLNGAQMEVEGDFDVPATILVGRDISPGGFAWMIPSGRKRLRVGMLTRCNPKTYLSKMMKVSFPDRPSDTVMTSIKVKVIAQGVFSRSFAERVVAVGEAAGQVKTTTGGGVAFGLLGADIAARTILRSFAKNDFTAQTLSRYENAWKAAVQREIVLGAMARRICARLSDLQMERIFHLAQTDGVIPIIREKGDFDWHGDLILALVKRLSFMKIFRGFSANRGPADFS